MAESSDQYHVRGNVLITPSEERKLPCQIIPVYGVLPYSTPPVPPKRYFRMYVRKYGVIYGLQYEGTAND